jgi:ribonuclease HI
MRVTIIADASHCPDTLAAGYGYWAISERGSRGGGGPLAKPIDKSSAAEMAALVNALYVALEVGIALPGDHVLLQTDCMGAIQALESKRTGLSSDERSAKGKFYELKKSADVTVSFRHVKGHTTVKDARSVTNRLCDERAKAGMRLARKRIKESRQ